MGTLTTLHPNYNQTTTTTDQKTYKGLVIHIRGLSLFFPTTTDNDDDNDERTQVYYTRNQKPNKNMESSYAALTENNRVARNVNREVGTVGYMAICILTERFLYNKTIQTKKA